MVVLMLQNSYKLPIYVGSIISAAEETSACFMGQKPRKDIVSCYKRKGFKNMQNQLKVIACAFLISFSCAVCAQSKSSAVILRNSLLATINAIGKEVGFSREI